MMPAKTIRIDKRSQNLMAVSGLWSLLLVFNCVFYYELYDEFWVLFIGWMLACDIMGICLFLWSVVAARKANFSRVPVTVSTCIFVLLFFFMTSGVFWGQVLRFHLEKHRYEAVIIRLQASPPSIEVRDGEPPFEVETISPLRVAFRLPGGILDNWSAVVYDPSGKVEKANRFKSDWKNWDNPALADVKELFGGDLMGSNHITGPWYFCYFT